MDPGGIFLFAPDSHIHECLRLLPPMPPHLQRGMKIYFNDLIYYGLLLPGSTAAHSKQNLIQWLDALVYGLSAASLVYDLDGNREHALFHRFKGPNFDKVTAALSSLNAWGAACTRAG